MNDLLDQANAVVEGVAFDAEKMKEAAQYINTGFVTLADDINAVTEKVKDHINSADGKSIKTPTSADAIYKVWDDAVRVRLDDFIKNFNSWSEVMAIVNATGAEFADETVSTYTSDNGETFEYADEGTISGLKAFLGVRGKDRVNEILSEEVTYTPEEWKDTMATLNEAEREAVRVRNSDTAKVLKKEYEKYLTMKPSDKGYDRIKNRIESQNPEVIDMLEEQMRNSHHR